MIGRARGWLAQHSIRAHLVARVWLRIPEKRRWSIVHRLNKSQRRCWCDLVDIALAWRESDLCDVHVPSLRGAGAPRCGSVCDWSHPDHVGEHDCNCYCGKFRFTATNGALERRVRPETTP